MATPKKLLPQKNLKKWLPQKCWRTLLRGRLLLHFGKIASLLRTGLLMRFKHYFDNCPTRILSCCTLQGLISAQEQGQLLPKKDLGCRAEAFVASQIPGPKSAQNGWFHSLNMFNSMEWTIEKKHGWLVNIGTCTSWFISGIMITYSREPINQLDSTCINLFASGIFNGSEWLLPKSTCWPCFTIQLFHWGYWIESVSRMLFNAQNLWWWSISVYPNKAGRASESWSVSGNHHEDEESPQA